MLPLSALMVQGGGILWYRVTYRESLRPLWLLLAAAIVISASPFAIARAMSISCFDALALPLTIECSAGRLESAGYALIRVLASALVAAVSADVVQKARYRRDKPRSLAGWAMAPLLFLALLASQAIVPPSSLPRVMEGDWWRWGPLPGLSNVAAMAATEELFWRGFLQEALLRLAPKRYSLPLAVTVVAAIWALLHVVWADYEEISAVVPLFIVAICFGAVAHRWGVMVTTVVHVAFNICVFLSLGE